jgi:hypothetical protein
MCVLIASSDLLALGASNKPAAKEPPAFADRVERWDIQEVTVRSTHQYANPFTDVSLKCKFTSGGEEVTAEGFYDGDRNWKVRLMPEVQGHWTFRTISSDPELDGETGTFEVSAPSAGNHGPVHVHERYHFGYEDGTPYFLLGTTTYRGLTGGPLERIRTMSKLAHSPFNKSRFMLLAGSSWVNGGGLSPFQTDLDGKPDYSRPNPEYYAEVEVGLRELESLRVEADLILFVPYFEKQGQHSMSDMGVANDEAYLHYAVARLAAFHNVWWTMANEYDLHTTPKDWKHLGELVQHADPYRHMLGIHNGCTAYYDNSESWITHAINQDLTLQRLTTVSRNDAFLELDARKIGKPVVVDEYSYEGNIGTAWGSIGPREIVEMHWSITMTGAYASYGESYYGSMDSFDFVGEAPKRLGFIKEIMTEAPYQEMEPANDLIHYPGAAYIVTALAKRGSYYLIHFPEAREASTWNTGVYGPATPSKPLPLKEPYGANPPSTFSTPTEVNIGEGIFKVDMIDTWQMKVVPLGYTTGPTQIFLPRITPGLLRLVKVDHAEPGAPIGDISKLMAALGMG